MRNGNRFSLIFLGVLALILTSLLTACSVHTNDQVASAADALPLPIIVTRDDDTLPQGCTAFEIAQFIVNFFDAFNQGDQEQLATMFSLQARGIKGWYSAGGDGNSDADFVAYDVNRLLTYFDQRYQHNERLQLVKVDFSYPGWHGGADVAFVVKRSADDIEPGVYGSERYTDGKGAIDCKEKKIMVWSMATQPPDTQDTSMLAARCPSPPPGSPEDAVIACVRGQ
jgi:hypothetical protein